MTNSVSETRRLRFATRAWLQGWATLVVAVLLLRVVGPGLIDLHNDILGWLGLAAFIAAPVLILWSAASLFWAWRKCVSANQPPKESE